MHRLLTLHILEQNFGLVLFAGWGLDYSRSHPYINCSRMLILYILFFPTQSYSDLTAFLKEELVLVLKTRT